MARQIIKQPNNMYSIYSSVPDAFIQQDLTKQEVIDFCVEEAREKEKQQLVDLFDKIENNKRPYYQFTLTYEEALSKHNRSLENQDEL